MDSDDDIIFSLVLNVHTHPQITTIGSLKNQNCRPNSNGYKYVPDSLVDQNNHHNLSIHVCFVCI